MTFNIQQQHQQAAGRVAQALQEIAAGSAAVPEMRQLAALATAEAMTPWAMLHAGEMIRHLQGLRRRQGMEQLALLLQHLQSDSGQAVPGPQVIPWRHRRSAPLESWDTLLEDLQRDPVFPSGLRSPGTTNRGGRAGESIKRAHRIICDTAPDRVAACVEHLVQQVIVARPVVGAAGFGGATTFWFRRACVVNADQVMTLPQAIDQVAHESAHAALFTIAQDELLCTNDDRQRFSAPHRADPRPMNGVIHGYAAMRWVSEALSAAQLALWDSPEDMAVVDELLAATMRKASELRDLIDAHAQLTELGREVVAWLS